MGLSTDLISQFAKVTKDETKTKQESTVLGTTVEYNGKLYVKIDGSDRLTPVSTTADMEDGNRVTVLIKDHTATVTGNISSPSASSTKVKEVGDQVTDLDIVLAYRVSTDELNAVLAHITTLKAVIAEFDSVSTDDLEAINAEIENLESKYINTESLTTKDLKVITATIESLEAKIATFTSVSTEDLEAAKAEIGQLKAYNANFTYVFANELSAINGNIKNLETNKLSAEEAEIKYLNLDFGNIDKAWMAKFYAKSGLIENATAGDAIITGRLVGVTIVGDLIEGGTVVADKLVIKGEDGLYYKLNTGANEPVYSGTTADGEEIYYTSVEVINYYKVSYNSETNEYSLTDEIIEALAGTVVEGAFTLTGEQVYSGTTDAGDTIYYTSTEAPVYYKVSYNSETEEYSITDEVIDAVEGIRVEGAYIASEQTEYNSINGKIITAGSITATQISVKDLVAFDATIGGFEIEDDSLHSFGKDSVESTVKGVYMNNQGEINFGDTNNFIKFHTTKSEEVRTYYRCDYDPNWQTEIFTRTDEIYTLPEVYEIDRTAADVWFTTNTGEPVIIIHDATGDNDEEIIPVCEVVTFEDRYDLEIKARKIAFGVDGKNVEDEIQGTKDTLEKHFEFEENGLVIKLGENAMKLRLDNDIIAFYNGPIDKNDLTKNRFGWWDGVDFHTGNIVVEVKQKAQFGNFAFIPRSDGSLSFLKVADEEVDQ